MHMKIIILFTMLLLHVYDDFHFQTNSFLANGKQKSWWQAQTTDTMYKHDYLVCLILHAFTWTCAIMLPVVLYNRLQVDFTHLLIFFMNMSIHAYIDDLKANRHKINLIQDQTAHILQIIGTWLIFVWFQV